MPAALVGALVDGRPNYLTIAYCGAVNHEPPIISVGLNKKHYTNRGIKENGTFSLNIPSADMVKITDYCGLVSGHRVDKSNIFKTFYGSLKTAPLIEECPLSLECRVVQVLELAMQNVYLGQVIQAYAEDRFLTNGLPDIKKMNPIVFSMHDNNYWTVGEHLGRAWSIGKELKAGLGGAR